MGGSGPVSSAITCAVQPVAKLSNLGAARSEDVGLEGGAGVGDEASKSSTSTSRTEGISRNRWTAAKTQPL